MNKLRNIMMVKFKLVQLEEMLNIFHRTCDEVIHSDHLVTGSDYPVLQDYEEYKETFAYIERLGLPKADTDKILHHNAQGLFGFNH